MTNGQMPFALAMDLNGTGTLVDVTTYVRGTDGLQKTGTKQDQFRDSVAATYTFVLENYDGRFTPGNTATYVNPPTERMTVNWSITNLGTSPTTTYHAGSILTLSPGDDNWTLLTVTCDDMLGAASRSTLGDLADSIGRLQSAYYPFNDVAGSGSATEFHGLPSMAPVLNGGTVTFGAPASGWVVGTQCEIVVAAAAVQTLASTPVVVNLVQQSSPVSNATTLGVVLTTKVSTTYLSVASDALWGRQLGVQNGFFYYFSVASSGWVATTTPCVPGTQYFVQGVRVNNTVWQMYVNGVLVATDTSIFVFSTFGPTTVTVGNASAGAGDVVLAEMMFGSSVLNVADAGTSTEAGRLTVIDQTVPQIALATLPTDLSTAPIGNAATTGQSVLDAFNAIIRTEQGYIDCVTTGTLTAPVQQIRIRARQRPATVSYSFDAQQEIDAPSGGTPIPFIRDSTNLIWSDSLTGANSTSQVVSQTALQARAGSNNASDTVSVYQASDLYEWGTDRLNRGANVALRPQSITIDNRKLATDRSADLNAMVPGDRIRITNIPSTILGFTTWDGWLLDKDEDHRSGLGACDRYILYLQPCQPTTGIFDTDLFDDGANNLLTTAMTNVTTSCIVGSVDGVTWFEQSTTGYYIQIDNEVMKVTAAAAPSGGNQTLTVTRAQNSTTAATHAIGAAPEVVDNPADVLNNALFAY